MNINGIISDRTGDVMVWGFLIELKWLNQVSPTV